ncbi:MAG TPA: hypothetical protein VFB37_01490 [Steroidobacteraceae bacterium]|nr:hypothetical protein [Steroidobacteraceae bacterium]
MSRVATAACAVLTAVVLADGASAYAETDASFRLSAAFADLPAYFPGYLGNGYISSLTAPRGTEPTRTYLVGLMDYAAGDMSRPASVPGWSEIDFSAGAAGSEFGWLNRVPLNDRHFADYRQTLDLHEATLTTRYRYLDRGRETEVEVLSLVSQAAPHLAATRFMITPNYDGIVRLSFALTLWAPPAPRFPLAQLSGPQMEEAVTASGRSLQPQSPATADRAAVWYPGYIRILNSGGAGDSLSLWLDGQAEQGLPMALAASVSLPEGVHPESIRVHPDRYKLALDVSVKVERGRTYTFTKYVALSRAGWGGKATEDLALARQARAEGFEHLLNEHRTAWSALWQPDIQIETDAKAQQAVHSEMYYLLASSTADTAWAPGACALTPGYAGHIFWDSDTWIFPALLLFHPERARSLVDFRERTLGAARQRAQQRGLAGAMFPWESDPEQGTEQTPHSAYVLGESEIHVNADIAIAQWQYFLATGDRDWLRTHGWLVIRDVARFWTSRASYDAHTHRYDIQHVTSVSESNTGISNDTFTNVLAARTLSIATTVAGLVGERPDRRWQEIARNLYIPLAPQHQHHLAFDPAVVPQGNDFAGGPVSLLFLPSLDVEMSPELRRGDYEYGVRPSSPALAGRVSMGIAPRSIAADTIGDETDAAAWFATNFSGGTLKPPFNVRTETADNNTGYFLTGSGGFIQSLVYGFSGLRIRESGLVEAYAAVLPAQWNSLTLRNLSFRGRHLDIRIARDHGGVVRLTRNLH